MDYTIIVVILTAFPLAMPFQPCTVNTDSSDGYQLAQNVSQDDELDNILNILNILFQRCRFGKSNVLPTASLCFDHCSVRRACFAVEFDETTGSCKFCIATNNDPQGISNVKMNTTYVRTDALIGKWLFLIDCERF